MRELGFTEKWPKLQQNTFTTYRFQRRDKDWQVGEVVRVVYKPRSKQREVLGVAKITDKVSRRLTATVQLGTPITPEEAQTDGFESLNAMFYWMCNRHGSRLWYEPMNKLTLQWVKPKRIVYMLDGEPTIAEVGGSPWGKEGDIAVDEAGKTRLEVIKVLEWQETESPLAKPDKGD